MMTFEEREAWDKLTKEETRRSTKNAKKVVKLLKKFDKNGVKIGVYEITFTPSNNREKKALEEIVSLIHTHNRTLAPTTKIQVEKLLDVCDFNTTRMFETLENADKNVYIHLWSKRSEVDLLNQIYA